MKNQSLDDLKSEISNCRSCAAHFLHVPRPVVRFNPNAKLLIVGQAPGSKVHNSGIPWNDQSGKRLRSWLNMNEQDFYDENRIAIVPMGLCYPGVNKSGGDNPPRPECASKWHSKIKFFLPNVKLTLLIGSYAQKYYLKTSNMTDTVRNWQEYLPEYIALPHPSWRNTSWIKKNQWFEDELVPELQKIVRNIK